MQLRNATIKLIISFDSCNYLVRTVRLFNSKQVFRKILWKDRIRIRQMDLSIKLTNEKLLFDNKIKKSGKQQ